MLLSLADSRRKGAGGHRYSARAKVSLTATERQEGFQRQHDVMILILRTRLGILDPAAVFERSDDDESDPRSLLKNG
jgi:hypothetical protein